MAASADVCKLCIMKRIAKPTTGETKQHAWLSVGCDTHSMCIMNRIATPTTADSMQYLLAFAADSLAADSSKPNT